MPFFRKKMKFSDLGPSYAFFVFDSLIKVSSKQMMEIDDLPTDEQRERRDTYLKAHLMTWLITVIGMASRPSYRATAHCVADHLFYTVCVDPDFEHWAEPDLRHELGICMQELRALGGIDVNQHIPGLGLWVAHKTNAENTKEKTEALVKAWADFCIKCVELVSLLQNDYKLIEDIKY
jgi:hypothetical protein